MIDLAVIFIFFNVGEEVAVDDANGGIFPYELQRLVNVLHLVVVGMGLAVRRNQTVDAERAIVRLVTKIATVQKWIMVIG